MRDINYSRFILLAGLLSLALCARPAAAQGGGSDPGRSATLVRPEGNSSGAVTFMPSYYGDFRMSLRLAFARFYLATWPVKRAPNSPAAADIPSRKRLVRLP